MMNPVKYYPKAIIIGSLMVFSGGEVHAKVNCPLGRTKSIYNKLSCANGAKGVDTSKWGYGQRREIHTGAVAEAAITAALCDSKGTKVGKAVERDLYFEAEVLDKDNKVVDRVIVIKRSGRIRSIL